MNKMKEIKDNDYKKFIKKNKKIKIGDNEIEIGKKKKIKAYSPKKFELEGSTIWSFPSRGNWATHKGDYRGNWAPEIPRNIISRYSKKGDMVLDPMVGSGTTLVECKLLGRIGIGIDVNKDAVMITRDRLNFSFNNLEKNFPKVEQKTFIGDARNLNLIGDNSIDLIATHPPYVNIISYTDEKGNGDLSNVCSVDEFQKEMEKVAKEFFRVLKPGKYCAILVGDTRRHKHYIPVAFRTLKTFLESGFLLKEDIIKHQWRCKTTGFWMKKSIENNFLLIMHEHLFVFRKPENKEDLEKFQESMKI